MSRRAKGRGPAAGGGGARRGDSSSPAGEASEWIREIGEEEANGERSAELMPLRGRDRRFLRGLAHGLRPIVRLGRNGLSPAVAGQIEQAIADHELIKVHLEGNRDERAAIAAAIAHATASAIVGAVGGIVILFRRQPDPEKRTIRLDTGSSG